MLVDSHLSNIPCIIFFKIDALVKEEKSFEGFLFLALAAVLFNGADLFVLLFYVHGKHLRSCRDDQLT